MLVDAAKSSPEHGDAFRWLGELILRKGDPDRARALLEYAEELMPTDAQVAELLVEAGGKPLPRVSPAQDRLRAHPGGRRPRAGRADARGLRPTPPTHGVAGSTRPTLDGKTPAVDVARGRRPIDGRHAGAAGRATARRDRRAVAAACSPGRAGQRLVLLGAVAGGGWGAGRWCWLLPRAAAGAAGRPCRRWCRRAPAQGARARRRWT